MRFLKATLKVFMILWFILLTDSFSFSEDLCDVFHFQILEPGSQKVLFEAPAAAGETFTLDYVHSSDKTPVHDVFWVDKAGTVVLIEEHFAWYGAGLEFHEGYRSAQAVHDGKGTRVLLRRPMAPFFLRVGRVAQHRITYRGAVIPLLHIANGGELLEIKVLGSDCKGRENNLNQSAAQ